MPQPLSARVWTVVIFILSSVGCSDESNDRAWMATSLATDVPLEVLFPLQHSYELVENPDHVIGGITGGVVGRDGTLFLVDFPMREVKRFRPDGSFGGVVGASGQGPGEYVAPLAVALDPGRRYLGVGDVGQRRVVIYDVTSLDKPKTIALGGPFSPHGLVLGNGDTMFVTGAVADYRSARPYAGAMMAGGDSVLKRFLELPKDLQQRELGNNVLLGLVSNSRRSVFMGLSGSPMFYRLSMSGRLIDSLLVPADVYRGIALPALGEWSGGVKEMQEFARTQEWVASIQALNDSALIVELQSYYPPDDDWRHRFLLLRWSETPDVTSTAPCQCELVGTAGERVAVTSGDGEPYVLEWRAVKNYVSR